MIRRMTLNSSRFYALILSVLMASAALWAQENGSALGTEGQTLADDTDPAQGSAVSSPASNAEMATVPQDFQKDVLRVLIYARIKGSDGTVLWEMKMDKLTVPGRGVNVRLNGDNLVVEVEFTPYLQPDNTIMLVAQGQTWVTSNEENKLRYQTSLKSIPVNAGEPVVFYPLGVDPDNANSVNLELEVTISNYISETIPSGQMDQSGKAGDSSGQ